MSAVELPKPMPESLSDLMSKVTSGRVKIPQFQRDFVWSLNKSAGLLDSIIKGYPVGTFIIWKTKERLRSVRNIGNMEFQDSPEGDYVHFVLDGQQRITSLIAALKGETIQRGDGRMEDFGRIVVDLEAEDGETIIKIADDKAEQRSIIDLKTLYEGDFDVLTQYDAKYKDNLKEYSNTLKAYNFSVIEVNDAPIHIATDIFTRMNEGGTRLSTFEIMVAKTYDPKSGFDMAEKFKALIDELGNVGYETLPDTSILQAISLALEGECKRKIILSLAKEKIIDIWDRVMKAIKEAIDYLKTYYRIPVSNMLPYKTLVVPLAYFFFNYDGKPYGNQRRYLDDFFWRVSLSGRYSSGVETKLTQDVKHIDRILDGDLPTYDWPIDTSPEFIRRNGRFGVGRSYIKAILCIYAYNQPRSFDNDSLVNIDNAWLRQSNSKNYHHFFPKAYLTKLDIEVEKINHILNITIVDAFLNKMSIRDRAPSDYIAEFDEKNSQLASTMTTHLIGDLDKFGVWSNSYDVFLTERANLLSKEIERRIIKREDTRPQPDLVNDASEESDME